MRVMQDIGSWDPKYAWRVEASQLAKGGDLSIERAFDCVLLTYLNQGDPQPLLDLLGGGRVPSRDAQKYIAAMMDFNALAPLMPIPVPFRFGFWESRRRGRPKAADSVSEVQRVFVDLLAGVGAIKSGKEPNARFWKRLLDSCFSEIDPEQHLKVHGARFPVRAKLVSTTGKRGRPRSPELEMRDQALAWFVTEAMRQGLGYDSALDKVAEENNVSRETVRNAYSGYGNLPTA